MPNTQRHIDQVCDYRDIPHITKGMACNVDGRQGKIVGGNTSSNFNVQFDDNGDMGNCHPYWRFQIYTPSGLLYYDHEQGIV